MIIKGENLMLPKAFKAKWVKALRSGKYKQGTETLKTGDRYCCLGVACAMQNDTLFLGGGTICQMTVDLNKIKIPKILQSSEYGFDRNESVPSRLIHMNDEGKSFKYIASYIERYL